MIFVQVNLYVKEGDQWSEPIPGFGGDFLIIKDKNGIHGNDEGYKMAITDALGSAAKVIGVAADIYRGRMESKYSRPAEPADVAVEEAPKAPHKLDSLRAIAAAAKEIGVTNDDIKEVMRRHYNKSASNELTDTEAEEMEKNFVSWVAEVKDDDSKLMEGV
jgi:transcription initiation factor TFIIIB Brf1 subunit/transcription initiation factor TFIIB